jgi:hypothetical protein
MSEPDAVPLPRDGEVFFDVRGDARSMRLSWYADSNVAVFSIWQGNRCTGTFRLPFADLARMVQTLQSGPPLSGSGQGDFASTSYGGYDSPRYASADYDGAGYQPGAYSGSGYGDLDQQPVTASYQAAGYSDPGYAGTGSYGANADAGYGADSDGGPSRSGFGAEPGYVDTGYAAGHPYDAQPSPSQEYPSPYSGTQEYPGQEYPGQDYGSAGYASAAPNYELTDYDPPNYSEPSGYHGGSHRRADIADDVAVHSRYRQPTESESVPDGAMLSFPSVPARNGPYR